MFEFDPELQNDASYLYRTMIEIDYDDDYGDFLSRVTSELQRRQSEDSLKKDGQPPQLLSISDRRSGVIPARTLLAHATNEELKSLEKTLASDNNSTLSKLVKRVVDDAQKLLKKECSKRGLDPASQMQSSQSARRSEHVSKKQHLKSATPAPVTEADVAAAAAAAAKLLAEEDRAKETAKGDLAKETTKGAKRAKDVAKPKKGETPRPEEAQRAAGAPAVVGGACVSTSATSLLAPDAARRGDAPAAASSAAAALAAPAVGSPCEPVKPRTSREDAVAAVASALAPTARSPLWRSARWSVLLSGALAEAVELGYRTAIEQREHLFTLTYSPDGSAAPNGAGTDRRGVRSLRSLADIALALAAASAAAPVPGHALIPGVAVLEDVHRLLDVDATVPLHTETLDKAACAGLEALAWCSPEALRLGPPVAGLVAQQRRVHVLGVGVRVDRALPGSGPTSGDVQPGGGGSSAAGPDGDLQQVALLGLACAPVADTYTGEGVSACYSSGGELAADSGFQRKDRGKH
jgi:hypothetical protein